MYSIFPHFQGVILFLLQQYFAFCWSYYSSRVIRNSKLKQLYMFFWLKHFVENVFYVNKLIIYEFQI